MDRFPKLHQGPLLPRARKAGLRVLCFRRPSTNRLLLPTTTQSDADDLAASPPYTPGKRCWSTFAAEPLLLFCKYTAAPPRRSSRTPLGAYPHAARANRRCLCSFTEIQVRRLASLPRRIGRRGREVVSVGLCGRGKKKTIC